MNGTKALSLRSLKPRRINRIEASGRQYRKYFNFIRPSSQINQNGKPQ